MKGIQKTHPRREVTVKGFVEKDGIVRMASKIQLGSYFNCFVSP